MNKSPTKSKNQSDQQGESKRPYNIKGLRFIKKKEPERQLWRDAIVTRSTITEKKTVEGTSLYRLVSQIPRNWYTGSYLDVCVILTRMT